MIHFVRIRASNSIGRRLLLSTPEQGAAPGHCRDLDIAELTRQIVRAEKGEANDLEADGE